MWASEIGDQLLRKTFSYSVGPPWRSKGPPEDYILILSQGARK